MSHLALRVGHDDRLVVLIEEDLSARRPGNHGLGWDAFDLHHERHVLFLVLAGEEGVTDVQLVQNAAERPHVDCRAVGNTEDDFWCSVESTLNVGVDLLVLEAATTEIDDFDAGLVDLPEQDVLGLQVAVDDVVLSHVVQ